MALTPESEPYASTIDAHLAHWVKASSPLPFWSGMTRQVRLTMRQAMTTATDHNCAVCRFWSRIPDEDGNELGQCRRFPPSYEGWAMVFGHDWCGEFAAS
jgi:hypothetical protein